MSIAGKTLRGTIGRHPGTVPLLSAFDHARGCVLSQTQVEPETNEHTAALKLLESLVLQGKVIVGADRGRIRTGSAPTNLTVSRNAAINFWQCEKTDNIAKALRQCDWNPHRLFAKLHLTYF